MIYGYRDPLQKWAEQEEKAAAMLLTRFAKFDPDQYTCALAKKGGAA